jgi:murein DD-endopeptidase MepM/ murein hydrolase activator NlpD
MHYVKVAASFFAGLRVKAVQSAQRVKGVFRTRGKEGKNRTVLFLQHLKGNMGQWLRASRKKIIFVTLVVSLVLAGAYAAYIYDLGFGYVLLVDGEEVAFVYESDKEEIEGYIVGLATQAAQFYNANVILNENVEFVRERRSGEHIEKEPVQDELHFQLSFSICGYALLVDGKETVVLASEEEHAELVELIQKTFVDDSNNTVVRNFDIQENLELRETVVSPEAVVSVEEALNLLLTGTDRRETYLVSRGDSLWSIARSRSMSVAELQQANPHVNSALIRPGDEINLIVSEPLVNVSVVEEITVREKIPFQTTYVNDNSMYTTQSKVLTKGAQGEREVTYLLTKENGVEVAREVIQENIFKEPVTQVVAKGTIRQPFQSTGRFGWPLPPGRGTLTSRFGMRWGSMHNGIDVAAPSGTAIRAADSGVVAVSAYRGSYGNLVIINHSNGYSTYYAHNSRNMVKAGQRVEKGQTIALMGSTGNSTGPHVHFEIRRNGTPINPLNFFRL